MAKIRHITYRVADLEAMAKFFVNAFGLTIVHRRSGGAIDLSDGTINLTIVPVREPGQRQGIDHIGFVVEDEDEALRLLKVAGAREVGRTTEPYQIKFQGPEGIVVEIGNWMGAKPIEEKRASK